MPNVNNVIVDGAIASPKGFLIEEALLTANNGSQFNIKNYIQDIKITESIYRSSITAAIYLLDSVNLVDRLKYAGNEKINLLIQRRELPSGDLKKYEIELYVAEVKDYSKNKPGTSTYTLMCVSKHAYINNVKVLKRSFSGTIGDLIQKIVKNDLSTKSHFINKSSKGLIKGIYPRLRPLSAISWLLKHSYEDSTPFFFYETLANGITFDSYKNMLDKEVIDEYNNFPNFKSDKITDPKKVYEEERKKIVKLNSNMNISKYIASSKGAFGSQLHKIDIFNKTYEKIGYNYSKMLKLNDNEPIIDAIEVGGRKLKDWNEGKNYFISLNTGAYDSHDNYHKPSDSTILKAEAYLANMDSIVQEIIIPGDFNMESGSLIDLNILKSADITEEQLEGETDLRDSILSGKHLVTSITHKFSSEGYFMTVTAKKDSFIKPLTEIIEAQS